MKMLLAIVVFSIGSGLQNLSSAYGYKTVLHEPNIANQSLQQDSLSQPDGKPRLHNAYPPVNPGQPNPDRVNPANNRSLVTPPADTSHKQQAPQRRKAKLAGEQQPDKK